MNRRIQILIIFVCLVSFATLWEMRPDECRTGSGGNQTLCID